MRAKFDSNTGKRNPISQDPIINSDYYLVFVNDLLFIS